jgi:transketolase
LTTRRPDRQSPLLGDATTLDDLGRAAREIVLRQSRRANVGHIGSALSVIEILIALRGRCVQAAGGADPDRDRLILSKGHAALALYAILHLGGLIDAAQLDSFCADGSLLGVHPEHTLAGVDFSTGSLGHGLSVGAGAALAARLQGTTRRTFVLMSDAELNEGSVWEAAMFAAHHRLAGLVAVVDCNGQQAFGHTRDVLDLEPLADRWRAFGWDVHEAPGHDVERLVTAINEPDTSGRPRLVIARTVFGRGVSYMERQIAWHYLPMSDEQFQQALRDVGRAGEAGT